MESGGVGSGESEPRSTHIPVLHRAAAEGRGKADGRGPRLPARASKPSRAERGGWLVGFELLGARSRARAPWGG